MARPIADAEMEDYAETAREGLAQIRAFFKYQGKDPVFEKKAKVGVGAIGAYSRLWASQTNRMGVELMRERLKAEAPPQLKEE
jgi:hypothetical protein